MTLVSITLIRLRHFESDESSRAPCLVVHLGHKWDVNYFSKNGGILFTGGIDPDAAIIKFDTEVVLDNMGCPPWLRVRVVVGAIHGA